MNILAFDQSSTISGWSYFNNSELQSSGVINKRKNKDSDSRIAQMGLALCAKIKELQPETVVIEDIQEQEFAQKQNPKTLIYLARIQGCVILYCASKHIPLYIVRPAVWRKTLGFRQGGGVKRDELKQQSVDYVKKHFDLELKSVDENEAVAIGAAANELYNTK